MKLGVKTVRASAETIKSEYIRESPCARTEVPRRRTQNVGLSVVCLQCRR